MGVLDCMFCCCHFEGGGQAEVRTTDSSQCSHLSLIPFVTVGKYKLVHVRVPRVQLPQTNSTLLIYLPKVKLHFNVESWHEITSIRLTRYRVTQLKPSLNPVRFA